MDKMRVGTEIRLFFILFSALILAGIWLTGFDVVHWLLYVPPALLLFGGVSGICPGVFVTRTITKK